MAIQQMSGATSESTTAKDWLALAHDLEARQSETPTDTALAHELGRIYYQLALQGPGDADIEPAVDYWTKVIANWAIVLEDDGYWQAWVGKRAQIYDTAISPETAQAACERLWQLLLADLTHFDEQAAPRLPYHDSLAIRMQLETTALRLLKQFATSSAADSPVVPLCGPLLLRQLDQEQALGQFVAVQVQRHGVSDNFLPMLHSLLGELNEEELSPSDRLGQLMLCYSQLGGALIYVQQGQSAAAVEFLRHVQCEACSPLSARATSADGKRAIEICQADCAQFARNNPAYSQMPDGWNRLRADMFNLAIEVCILGARDLLREDEPDYAEVRSLWDNALTLAWYDERKHQVRQQITDSVLVQVSALEKARKWQQAAEVLEAAAEVAEAEQLTGRRIKMLSYDAVSRAKEDDWAGAASALRITYRLNPLSDKIRDDLLFVLERHADQVAAERNYEDAREILGEAETILAQALQKESRSQDEAVAEQLENVRFKRNFAYMDFWHHSPLFNRAIAEAERLGQHYLGVEHLFLSLAKVEGGLTQQTLYQLGIPPVHMRNEIRQYVGPGDGIEYWEFTYFTPRLRRVLLRAIELARARGTTALDEPDFLYAIVQEPESAPMQAMLALGLPVQELPHWQPLPSALSGQYPADTTVFIYLSGPEDGKIVVCDRPTIAIGRADDNDVVLHFDHRLSRRHARLTVTDSGYILEDLDSTVGTYLEWNTPVTAPTPLTSGARFKVGQTWLRIWQT
jgi:hypothetical protein